LYQDFGRRRTEMTH